MSDPTVPAPPEEIDQIVQRRNAIQFEAENISEQKAAECWIRLGVANRHIERVIGKILPLPVVRGEIEDCFRRVNAWLNEGKINDKPSIGKS